MISRLRKAVSIAAGAMLISASFVAISATPAQATPHDSGPDCLVINANDELISGESCSGDLVIPARVKTIKQNAFVNFDGQISFEANSQLTTVEPNAFALGTTLRGITFPQSLVNLPSSAAWSLGLRFAYLNASNSNVSSNALASTSIGKVIIPRHVSSRPISTQATGWQYISPFEIDCNTLTGDRDFVGSNFLPLELSNCKDPRSPSASSPPNKIGYVFNQGLNQSVYLQSLDGSKSATVRLLDSPGVGGTKASVVQRMDGPAFSANVFGDLIPVPAGMTMSCQLNGSNPLPAGVTLSSDCQLLAVDTSGMTTSSQVISVNWIAHSGVANSVDVAADHDAPVSDWDTSGTVNVRIALIKTSELTPAAIYQNLVSAANYSGSTVTWADALAAYRAIPSGQVPAGPLDPGIAATLATEQFEQGSGSEASATAAIATFAAAAATGSTYLAQLKLRVATRAATNAVAAFESNGLRAQMVKTQILDLPTSSERSALLTRFNSAANAAFHMTTSQSGDTATLVYQNPYLAETFTVPRGVSRIHLDMTGAQGSQGGASSGIRPDRAGFVGSVSGDLAVTAGQTLTIGVGEAASDAPADCLAGQQTVATDSRIARGGSNPLGGYSGGNGGTPGTDNCGGYGGAGGAASVVKVGNGSSPAPVATIVAGGSAGSTGSSSQMVGKIGLSAAASRADAALTSGQSGSSMYRWIFPDFPFDPVVGGALAGGGGGAIGGATGFFDLNVYCGQLDYCATAASPGQNSTAGLAGLNAGFVAYSFADGLNANGRVAISYVIPPPSSDPAGSNGSSPTDGSTGSPSPSATPTPSVAPPGAPTAVSVTPIWKGAEVSWSAPVENAGAPIIGYEVTASTGQTCQTKGLSCSLSGLTPGQHLEVTVRSLTASAKSAPTVLSGSKIFIPLSINLWQMSESNNTLGPKLLNPGQLSTLRKMLAQDHGGFVLNVRLAVNLSKLSKVELQNLFNQEVKALKGQLKAAGLISKVTFHAAIAPPNSIAKNPSVVLVSHKP